jgi:hypothetical protein
MDFEYFYQKWEQLFEGTFFGYWWGEMVIWWMDLEEFCHECVVNC